MTFEAHCIAGARQFLHTALVIDDRAELGNDEEVGPKTAVKAEPLRARAEPAAEKGGEKPHDAPQQVAADKSVSGPAEKASDGAREGVEMEAEEVSPPDVAAHLNAKALTDAFLAAEVICGVHKPTGEGNSVDLAVKAATRADIVIVDWYLEQGSSAKAKAIISGILKADIAQHGRLRLIAIYTSEPSRADVATDLLKSLEEAPELKGRLAVESGGTSLSGTDTRVCVFNKEGSVQAAGGLAVSEGDLPEHLLREFVKMTNGLLANFAVTSIAAVRRGAHHVLARFRNQLDGAYLAHRVSLKNPGEAQDMALERISAELASLVENANVPEQTLSPSVLDAWVDARPQNASFKNAAALIPNDMMKELVRGGLDRLADKNGQTKTNGQPGAPTNPISDKTILDTFYPDATAARVAARDFARLTSFKREVGRVRLDQFRPILTLGAVLKVRRDLGETALYEDIEGDVLLCVQPRCDSVRLEGPRAFPFQQAKYDPAKFNMIVDGDGSTGYLHLDVKPMGAVMIRFAPQQNETAIFATRDDTAFLFLDAKGRTFEWIADLDDLKAQRFASDVGANMHRVGVDEFEWLRLGAAGKVKPEAPAVAPAPAPGAPA